MGWNPGPGAMGRPQTGDMDSNSKQAAQPKAGTKAKAAKVPKVGWNKLNVGKCLSTTWAFATNLTLARLTNYVKNA